MIEALLFLAITLVILAVVVGVFVWVVRYMRWPDIVAKGIVVIGVLFAVVLLVRFFNGHHDAIAW